ncbi:tetratricopeptide repeat protein [Hoylesella oralis ATCC 33269]|uniref:Tetratricopeptide repeat protein n=1 Tax=Hoylesella oralis ATCC 33269 TaxID=873533 RepID=E7RNF4_9BACT|nr:tetratricopeptide repeat protein [Hoylesella oralis]EFZ38285.1 tetratricopeptide repeat protein [Hoylesella oralis ATCC 33269]
MAIVPSFAFENGRYADKKSDVNRLSPNDRKRYDYFFLEAMRQQNAGHFDAAYDLLNHCLEIDSTAAEAYYMLAMYLTELKKDTLALQNIERAAALDSTNETYQERVAQYYISMGDYDRAILSYERLYAANHERTDVLNILVQLYQQKKSYSDMLNTINRIEQAEGTSEEITLSKMRVYEMMGDSKAAYKTLKNLSDTHPNDLNYRIMLGNWLMQNKREKEAYKIFISALKEEPDNSYAQTSLYDYYNTVGTKEQAQTLRDAILLSKKTPSQTKMLLLQEVIKNNEDQTVSDSTQILKLFDRVMAADVHNADIATLKAAYMTLKKMPQAMVDSALQHVLDISPDNAGARMQLIRSYLDKKDWDKIIYLCKPGMQYNPEEMAFYYFMGWSYFQKGDSDAALDAFRRGVSEINSQSDPDIASDFYAMMGDILHQKGNRVEAFAAYDSCLQWKSDNIYCLNNYAYYLSEEGENLQKAEQMSYKTIKSEPKNSTFLDTYAWILFMEQRYAEAKIYIDQAIQNDTDSVKNAVVIEHAGDIYAMNGDTRQALQYWQEAVKAGGDSALLQRKIKLKKYIPVENKKK